MGRFGSLLSGIGVAPIPTPEEWAIQLDQLRAMEAQAQAQQNAQYSQQVMANAQNAYAPPKPDYHDRARKLFMDRMNGVRDEFKLKTGDFLHCHLHGDMVYVFFLLYGKEGVVKEAVDIFPSDQMIAQFRVVIS